MNIEQLEQFSPGHWFYDVNDQLKRHIYTRSRKAFAAGDAARDALATAEAIQARQQAIREAILAAVGGLPPSDTPLHAETVGVVEGDGFTVAKVIFQSRPQHYVTANLYLPDGIQEPRGAALFLCGHHREAKHVGEYQIVCQYLAQAGLIVLAQDPIGQGERFSYYEPILKAPTVGDGTNEHDYAGAQCLPLGDGIARYFLHDAMRGLDYLRSRPEVDGDRIGVTGNSGGGTQSCLLMLADPRLAAAAPATFLMTRETYMDCGGAQDAEQIWYGFTAAGFDHEDVLIAMVPRPVLVLAVTSDFFPIEGTRRAVSRCQRFWELYGKEDGLALFEDNSLHAYTRKMARATATFFARHLLDKAEVAFEEERIRDFPPQTLWCTQSGQVRGEIEDAVFVYEENQARVNEWERARQSLPAAERRERAITWLREKVMQARQPCDLNPRYYHSDRMEELLVQMGIWRAQEGLFNHGYAFRHFRFQDEPLPVTLAVWDRGTNCLLPHLDWIRQTCEAGRAVFVLDTSGVGALLPRSITASPPEAFYGVIHKLCDDLFWLDDNLAALRTFDVLRCLEMLAEWPKVNASDIRLYAGGRQGIYGRLAAVLDTRIQSVEVAGGIRSYAEWIGTRHYETHYGPHTKSVLLRGLLRYADLPEIEC